MRSADDDAPAAEPGSAGDWRDVPYEVIEAAFYACARDALDQERRKKAWEPSGGWGTHDEGVLARTRDARDGLYALYDLLWRQRSGSNG